MNRAAARTGLLAAILAALALPAAAQTMFKSTMPDGKVVYGDKPAPGAAKVEPITPDPGNTVPAGATPGEKQRLQQMQGSRMDREKADERVRAALKKVQDAEAARAAGQEPIEGERIGTAGGASRLNDSYYARMKQLDAAVENARRELQQAQSAVK